MNEETLFHLAREKPPGERAAFLDEACAGDAALRRRVEVLLGAHEAPASFLDRPILEGGAELPGTLEPQGLPAPHPEFAAEAATLPPSEHPPAGPAPGSKVRYFGDYELLEEIARGGMGVVYKARQVSLNRIVALKMILAGQLASEADIQRFHREAEAAANLDHPNIVPIYEIGEYEGQHYFSMKLIEKGSLAQPENNWQSIRGSKDQQKRMAMVMAAVARAVHHAHQRGILHRDLKPGNILIDAQGQPQVTDFGLAKRLDLGTSLKAEPTPTGGTMMTTATPLKAALTHDGAIMGTPSYMAPEQARGEKMLTPVVDVYALGAIFYELLTGRPPFRADTPLDTVLQVLEREPEPPRELNRLVAPDLEAICLKCMQKEATKRYASAEAVAQDLEGWLVGQTIQARPSGPAKKAWKWAKRNPTMTALLVVLVLWFFDVRLPWRWAWLQYAWYGLLLLSFVPLALGRLVVVCGRAIGRFRNTPLDLANDGILLPGAVLAMFVLCFYPGDLADRKSFAFAIVLTCITWGLVAQWLWRRMQAGPLSLVLRTPVQFGIILGFFFGLLIIQDMNKLIHVSEQTGDLLVNVCSRIQSLSGTIFLFLLLVVGIEFRKQGCVTFFRFIRWEEIESYEWSQPTKEFLSLRLNLHKEPGNLERIPLLKLFIYPAKKESVDRVLLEHVPERGPGVTTAADSSQGFVRREREPAERLRDAAALLILSGIVQILASPLLLGLLAGLDPGFGQERGISTIVVLLVLVLMAASISVGLIVIAGAVKMRKLKSYPFCRMCSILAMFPLGFGFVLGLPFGIWALLVLRRADVKAAFVGNESRKS